MRVWIGYTEKDAPIATRIVEALRPQRVRAYMFCDSGDRERVSPVLNALQKADAVVILLPADRHKYSALGAAFVYAVRQESIGRRLVPVLTDPDLDLPAPLKREQCIDLSAPDKVSAGIAALLTRLASYQEVEDKDAARRLLTSAEVYDALQSSFQQVRLDADRFRHIQLREQFRTLVSVIGVLFAIVAVIALLTLVFTTVLSDVAPQVMSLVGLLGGLLGAFVGVYIARRSKQLAAQSERQRDRIAAEMQLRERMLEDRLTGIGHLFEKYQHLQRELAEENTQLKGEQRELRLRMVQVANMLGEVLNQLPPDKARELERKLVQINEVRRG